MTIRSLFSVSLACFLFYIQGSECTSDKCDLGVWYKTKIADGLRVEDFTEEQKNAKIEIEALLENNEQLVDCTDLEKYESLFASYGNDQSEEDGDETDTGEEFDETEMDEDEIEYAEDENIEESEEAQDNEGVSADSTVDAEKEESSSQTLESQDSKTPEDEALDSLKYKETSDSTNGQPKESTKAEPEDEKVQEGGGETNGSGRDESEGGEAKGSGRDESEGGGEIKGSEGDESVGGGETKSSERDESEGGDEMKGSQKEDSDTKSVQEKDTKTTKGSTKDDTGNDSKTKNDPAKKETENSKMKDPTKDEPEKDTKDDSDEETKSKNSEKDKNKVKSNKFTINKETPPNTGIPADFHIKQFQQLIEKTADEYMMKMQTLETQIMRLENELLTEKLNKQNHSSSFTRLENQILKLENELLKMNLSYEELKEENEKISKKQKSFLELDYVKRPGDRPVLPDNSTKHTEIISQHQNKISELTNHLRNQSQLIDKIKGQSDNLEEQNRMLFQIVMNQTMLISQMMKKVETLSDSNLKQHLQQQLLSDKLGIALASTHAMDDLHALVSDKLRTAQEDVLIQTGKSFKINAGQSNPVTLVNCKVPKKTLVICGFIRAVLKQCLWNEVHSDQRDHKVAEDKDNVSKSKGSKPAKKTTNVSETKPKEGKSAKTSTKNKQTSASTSNNKSKEVQGEDVKKTPTGQREKENSDKGDEKETYKASSQADEKKITKNQTGSESTEGKQTVDESDNSQKVDLAEKEKRDVKLDSADPESKGGEKDAKLDPAVQESKGGEKDAKLDSAVPQSKGGEKDAKLADQKTDVNEKNQPDKVEAKKQLNKAPAQKKKGAQKKRGVVRIPPLYNATNQREPKDCLGHFNNRKTKDGQYKIQLHGSDSMVPVFCDMKNGGWTVIQRRQDGTVNFFKGWEAYKKGFGGVYGEHWLGNDNIHRLTNQGEYELRIDLMAWNKTKKFALYEYVRVEGEEDGYRLFVEGYSGDAGDGLSKHSGEKFSTKDRDNDRVTKQFDGSCANRFKGAWWYFNCYASNLNGKFYKNGIIPEKLFDGITWKPWTGPNVALKKVEIKLRPVKRKK